MQMRPDAGANGSQTVIVCTADARRELVSQQDHWCLNQERKSDTDSWFRFTRYPPHPGDSLNAHGSVDHPTRTAMTTRILVASSRLPEVAMICGNMPRFAAVRTLVLAALFVIGLAATTPLPALAANSGTWANTGSMNTTRTAHSATLLPNGQVLVAGGESSTGGLTSAELYNPVTGKWTFTGSMATRRYAHTAVLLPSGEVLVATQLLRRLDH